MGAKLRISYKTCPMKELKILFVLFSLLFAFACEKEKPGVPPVDSASGDPATVNADTSQTDSGTPVPNEDADADETVSYLALGDSYTIGASVAESERFPVLLANELEEEGVAIQEPEIIAVTGWTTGDLKRGIAQANIEDKEYDLVSLLIGVNNQYQGRSLEEYREEFRELLLQSIDLANGNKEKVFVISIPDYRYTPFGAASRERISGEIDAFNAANKEIATSLGVTYFNITPISRKGLSDPSLVAADGLHPSGKMYQQWVDLMLEEVIALLKKS